MLSHASPPNSDSEKQQQQQQQLVSTKSWKKSKDNMWYGFAAVNEHEMILMTGFPRFPLNKV